MRFSGSRDPKNCQNLPQVAKVGLIQMGHPGIRVRRFVECILAGILPFPVARSGLRERIQNTRKERKQFVERKENHDAPTYQLGRRQSEGKDANCETHPAIGLPGAVPPRFEISRDPAWRVRVVRKFRYEEAGHREAMSSASNLSNSSRHERLCGSWSDMIENLPRTGYDLAKQNGRAVSLNPAPIRQNGIRRISQPKGTPSGERFKNTLKGGW